MRLDKFYTDPQVAKYCIDKTYETIGLDNITEIIEPSAGNGSFSNQMPNCLAYDIRPEGEGIIEQDYLTLEKIYKLGRLIIGNPPFLRSNSGVIKFLNKSFQIADFISFILPISCYKNPNIGCQFDKIYEEDLGETIFNDSRNIHCCLIIFRRPLNGLNKRVFYHKFVKIIEERRSGKQIKNDCDFRICAWGNDVGKKCNFNQYAKVFAITILDNLERDQIVELLQEDNIKNIIPYKVNNAPCLNQWHIHNYLNKNLI